jgi:two-component system nitrogen regulation response regulator GlnG
MSGMNDTLATLAPGWKTDAVDGAAIRPVGLTILAHPSHDRIGEIAVFEASKPEWEVSRSSPGFFAVRSTMPRPLETRSISRHPIVLRPLADGGVEIAFDPDRVTLHADGLLLGGRTRFDRGNVELGIVLLINTRLGLLVHRPAPPDGMWTESDLVGASPAMVLLRERITTVARADVSVLISGESGTGKELVALALHKQSGRSDRDLLSANMSALPSALVASELFGHEAGAFTGAAKRRPGLFRSADGGTLFLDEIGHTPIGVQLAMLRVLECGEVTPVGASRSMRVDVRVVAATDRDLETAITEGSFHGALLERLAGVELAIPALRDRPDDIPRLLLHFLRIFLEPRQVRRLLDTQDSAWLPADVLTDMVRYRWPRNVRQLRNVAQEIALFSTEGAFQPGDKLQRILDDVRRVKSLLPRPVTPGRSVRTTSNSADLDAEQVRMALRANKHGIAAAARQLNVSKQAMYRLLDRFEILYAKQLDHDAFAEHLDAAGGDITRMAATLEISVRALKLRRTALGL